MKLANTARSYSFDTLTCVNEQKKWDKKYFVPLIWNVFFLGTGNSYHNFPRNTVPYRSFFTFLCSFCMREIFSIRMLAGKTLDWKTLSVWSHSSLTAHFSHRSDSFYIYVSQDYFMVGDSFSVILLRLGSSACTVRYRYHKCWWNTIRYPVRTVVL